MLLSDVKKDSRPLLAFTLLELVVSLASSFVLVAGLAGSLYISNEALTGSMNARQSLAASTVLRDVMADVSQATSFSERTAQAITFTVPDRDGDSAPELIRYAWSGVVGDPLTYEYNGSAPVDVASDVQAFNLSALTRLLTSATISAPVAAGIVYEGFSEQPLATSGTQISIAQPGGTAEGDLLIACVATDASSTLQTPSGWTLLHSGAGTRFGITNVTFGVWWKIASASDSSTYSFTWLTSRPAYGWIMRFTGHDPTSPINASAIAGGTNSSTSPPCPPVTTTVENAMIVRLGGFDANKITSDSPGLTAPSPHSAITMDYSSNSTSGCSGGAGYLLQSTAGDSGTSAFALTSTGEEYVTVTIAIAPDTSE